MLARSDVRIRSAQVWLHQARSAGSAKHHTDADERHLGESGLERPVLQSTTGIGFAAHGARHVSIDGLPTVQARSGRMPRHRGVVGVAHGDQAAGRVTRRISRSAATGSLRCCRT